LKAYPRMPKKQREGKDFQVLAKSQTKFISWLKIFANRNSLITMKLLFVWTRAFAMIIQRQNISNLQFKCLSK
jgi:hypothetical protein